MQMSNKIGLINILLKYCTVFALIINNIASVAMVNTSFMPPNGTKHNSERYVHVAFEPNVCVKRKKGDPTAVSERFDLTLLVLLLIFHARNVRTKNCLWLIFCEFGGHRQYFVFGLDFEFMPSYRYRNYFSFIFRHHAERRLICFMGWFWICLFINLIKSDVCVVVKSTTDPIQNRMQFRWPFYKWYLNAAKCKHQKS